MPTDITLWPTLLEAVNDHHGVYKVKMSTLRQMEGAQRMGPNVAESVHNRLSTLGLEHLPADLNIRQDREVLLMKAGTDAVEVVRAIQGLLTGETEVSDRASDLLGRLNQLPDPEKMVSREALREPVENLLDTVTQVLSMTSKPVEEEQEMNI